MLTRKRIVIIGKGQFGSFIATHLGKHFDIDFLSRTSDPSLVKGCAVLIFAVPYNGLLHAIERVRPHLASDVLVCDVTSVKVKPLSLLKKYFPHNEIIGTHPIFGPQSGKNGTAGLPVVVCNVSARVQTYKKFVRFLRNVLQLSVIEQTPKEHDVEMAHVQAVTHFLGKALIAIGVKNYATNTKSYAHLVELCDLIRYDSEALFETIQNVNPEAKRVRTKLLRVLNRIHEKLD